MLHDLGILLELRGVLAFSAHISHVGTPPSRSHLLHGLLRRGVGDFQSEGREKRVESNLFRNSLAHYGCRGSDHVSPLLVDTPMGMDRLRGDAALWTDLRDYRCDSDSGTPEE